MVKFKTTKNFDSWIQKLRDPQGRAIIVQRLDRATQGNFGDVAPVGNGISEMRINFGPGYRVYFARDGEVVYVLLCGGNKRSQPRDIDLAKKIWSELKGAQK